MSRRFNYFVDFFDHIVADEILLRLLHYSASHVEDDVTITTPDRPTIIGNNTIYKNNLPLYNHILQNNIKRAPKSSDLLTTPICRLCMYLGNSIKPSKTNSAKVFKQDIIFDVFVNIDNFEVKDCRSAKICDRLDDLVHETYITGIGKAESNTTQIIGNSPDGYIGYRMIFTFGATK